jgi:hypothetical protein
MKIVLDRRLAAVWNARPGPGREVLAIVYI